MGSKSVAVIVVILVLLVGAYLGRHQIKAMLGMSTPTPASYQQTTTPTTPPTSSASATQNSLTMTKSDPKKGDYLVDSKSMTLYIFDKDTQNKSNCTGNCLVVWPPFKAPTGTATNLPTNYGIITTANGTYQYTYKGMPLYYYQKDTKPGDILGDGVGTVWHLVKP